MAVTPERSASGSERELQFGAVRRTYQGVAMSRATPMGGAYGQNSLRESMRQSERGRDL